MSRPRTRPTREDTRNRLLRAAARVFADKGIGTASIEDICDEAGFSRGAFYSNFKAKDDLVMAILELQILESSAEATRLFGVASDPTDFIANLETDRRKRNGPLDFVGGEMLYIELLLHAMRNPENRPKLVEYQRIQRAGNKELLEQIVQAVGRDYPIPLDQVASLVMAIDLGVEFHALIDPESNPPNQFSNFMSLIHQLWMSSDPDKWDS